MIDAFLLHSLILLGFLLLLGWAAIEDFAGLRIPNRITALIVILYLPYAATSPIPVNALTALSTAAIFFLLGMLLFKFGLMGGGDVKLMAAIGLWAGPELGLWFIAVTSIAGGALALVACTPLRFILGHAQTAIAPASDGAAIAKGIVPYGLAIAAGGAFVAGRLFVV
jgi:prepilin peptidase CpaA